MYTAIKRVRAVDGAILVAVLGDSLSLDGAVRVVARESGYPLETMYTVQRRDLTFVYTTRMRHAIASITFNDSW